MNRDSARTNVRIRALENPSVFNTASSLVRSRTACAIVLATTRRIVKSTAVKMAIMIDLMSPTCLAKPSMKAFSVVVFVSAAEFANMRVEGCCDFARWDGSCDLDHDTSPTNPSPMLPVLVQIVVTKKESVLVHRWTALAVVDADKVELPGRAAGFRAVRYVP